MNPADYLSTEDAERFDRARDPDWWELYDNNPLGRSIGFAERIIAIQRAWGAARPETGRKLDEAALNLATRFDEIRVFGPGWEQLLDHGRHLLVGTQP